MDKKYRVLITAIDPETNEETVELDELYTGLTMVADCEEGKMAEIVLHDTIANMAAKLSAGNKTAKAVRFANFVMEMRKEEAGNAETNLLRAIMGDM